MSTFPPPYATLMGMRSVQQDGRLITEMPMQDMLLGRPGFLHGGAMAGLMEIAAWAVLLDSLPQGESVRLKPISISIDFMRGGKTETSFATARIVRLGRRVANVEAWCWQEDESKPLAIASVKFLLARPREDAPAQ